MKKFLTTLSLLLAFSCSVFMPTNINANNANDNKIETRGPLIETVTRYKEMTFESDVWTYTTVIVAADFKVTNESMVEYIVDSARVISASNGTTVKIRGVSYTKKQVNINCSISFDGCTRNYTFVVNY